MVSILFFAFLYDFFGCSGVEVQCLLYDKCAARAFKDRPIDPSGPVVMLFTFARIGFTENGIFLLRIFGCLIMLLSVFNVPLHVSFIYYICFL